MWDIFPFEPAGLVARRLDPLTLPEPPRQGEEGRECARCARPHERVVWSDEHWTLSGFAEPLGVPFAAILESRMHLDLGDLDDERAAELGRLIVTVERAAQALPGVARVHVNRWETAARTCMSSSSAGPPGCCNCADRAFRYGRRCCPGFRPQRPVRPCVRWLPLWPAAAAGPVRESACGWLNACG